MNDKTPYNLVILLQEEIDRYYNENGISPSRVEVNADMWREASAIHGFPDSVYVSRVVCGQTVWPVSGVEYISVL